MLWRKLFGMSNRLAHDQIPIYSVSDIDTRCIRLYYIFCL